MDKVFHSVVNPCAQVDEVADGERAGSLAIHGHFDKSGRETGLGGEFGEAFTIGCEAVVIVAGIGGDGYFAGDDVEGEVAGGAWLGIFD